MSQTYTLGQLNALPAAGFVQVLGSIYEHSPWVAEAAPDPVFNDDAWLQGRAAAGTGLRR